MEKKVMQAAPVVVKWQPEDTKQFAMVIEWRAVAPKQSAVVVKW